MCQLLVTHCSPDGCATDECRDRLPRHRNPPPPQEGGPNHWEIWLKDPDGYVVVLASPDGSADANWTVPNA